MAIKSRQAASIWKLNVRTSDFKLMKIYDSIEIELFRWLFLRAIVGPSASAHS